MRNSGIEVALTFLHKLIMAINPDFYSINKEYFETIIKKSLSIRYRNMKLSKSLINNEIIAKRIAKLPIISKANCIKNMAQSRVLFSHQAGAVLNENRNGGSSCILGEIRRW